MAKTTLFKGILAGSFALFLSKLLGLIYVIPLNSFAGDANMTYYSIAYSYYGLILNVCSAGLPFAIASLVAKYKASDDYQTIRLVRKCGSSIVLLLSFITMIIFSFFIKDIATYSLGTSASDSDIVKLQICLFILVISLVFVPFLASLRGYYQGLKNFKVYASSQVIEQFIRVFAIIFLAYILVRVLNFENIYAIYIAVFAATIGAICSLFYLYFSTKKENKKIKELLTLAKASDKTKREIISELFALALPFIITSFLSTLAPLINSTFFVREATALGIDYERAKLVLGILQVNVSKLTSIPLVIALGYSAGLVPYLSEALSNNDHFRLSKYINDIVNSIFFIVIPLAFLFYRLARPIYYVMYGNHNLNLASQILAHSALLVLLDTIYPVLTSMLITLKRRNIVISVLSIGILIKFISFRISLVFFSYLGIIYSSFFDALFVVIVLMLIINRLYKLKIKKSLKIILYTALASFSMNAIFTIYSLIGLTFTYNNRLIDFIILGIYGFSAIVIFIFCANILGLIKLVANKSLMEFALMLKRRIFRS